MRSNQRALAGGGSDDAILVREALAGSGGAYDRLYRRHRDRVARAAYIALRDAHAAQDVAQEAFLVGWRDLGRLREHRLFRAWVTGIALNLCRRRSFLRRLAGGLPHPDREDPVPGHEEATDLRLVVGRAVAALSPRLRGVVVLRFYGQFSEPEIAAALDIPVGTVKSRLQRARTRLAATLAPIAEEE